MEDEWEQVVDAQGRAFWVNHFTQETSWHRPNKEVGGSGECPGVIRPFLKTEKTEHTHPPGCWADTSIVECITLIPI